MATDDLNGMIAVEDWTGGETSLVDPMKFGTGENYKKSRAEVDASNMEPTGHVKTKRSL